MNVENLEKQLEIWKRLLWISAGASLTLLATAVAEIPNTRYQAYFPGWYAVWLILQIAVTPPGLALLIGKTWRALPLSYRLNTAFGFLTIAWLTFLALPMRTLTQTPVALPILALSFGIAIALAYLWQRKWHSPKAGELFP